jgi:hypothetical protein
VEWVRGASFDRPRQNDGSVGGLFTAQRKAFAFS